MAVLFCVEKGNAMIAENNITYDGRVYKKGEEIWDLGSFVATSVNGNIRDYDGLSSDASKLPHYVGTGSSAYCIDTGEIYIYEKSSDKWYLQ